MSTEKAKYGLDLSAEVVKSGLIWKRSRARSRNIFALMGFRNWKERMFVLKGNKELVYYKAGHMGEVKGTIDIRNAAVKAVLPDQAAGKKNAFEIVLEGGERILLYVEDNEDFEPWKYAVEEVGKKVCG